MRAARPLVAVRAVALGAAAVLALAACGSSGGTAAAGGAGTTTPDEDSSSPPTTAAAPTSIDVCSLVSASQAAQLAGQPYTVAVPESQPGDVACAYNNDNATAEGVTITAIVDNVTSTWDAVSAAGYATVDGVGDKAVWDNDNTLYVVAGAVMVEVNGLSDQAKSISLAQAVLPSLQ